MVRPSLHSLKGIKCPKKGGERCERWWKVSSKVRNVEEVRQLVGSDRPGAWVIAEETNLGKETRKILNEDVEMVSSP